MALNMSTQIARNTDLLYAAAVDELMMMDIETGNYFGLDSIGSRIWELLAAPTTVGEICARLISEYDVAPDMCQAEVLTFLNKLVANRIVNVSEK